MSRKKPNRSAEATAGDAISQKLRQFYDSLTEDKVPDRFLDLLEKLDEADKAHGSAGKSGRNGDVR